MPVVAHWVTAAWAKRLAHMLNQKKKQHPPAACCRLLAITVTRAADSWNVPCSSAPLASWCPRETSCGGARPSGEQPLQTSRQRPSFGWESWRVRLLDPQVNAQALHVPSHSTDNSQDGGSEKVSCTGSNFAHMSTLGSVQSSHEASMQFCARPL